MALYVRRPRRDEVRISLGLLSCCLHYEMKVKAKLKSIKIVP